MRSLRCVLLALYIVYSRCSLSVNRVPRTYPTPHRRPALECFLSQPLRMSVDNVSERMSFTDITLNLITMVRMPL